MKQIISQWTVIAALFLYIEIGHAVEFESLGQAIAKAIGTKQALKTSVKVKGGAGPKDGKGKLDTGAITVFYPKGKSVKNIAVIQKGIYDPDCTHTWVIGMNASNASVNQIRVVEMSCPHAFPTKEASFLSQFKGKGPKDLKKLDGDIRTIAKATGSSELATDAVKIAIQAAEKLKGKL